MAIKQMSAWQAAAPVIFLIMYSIPASAVHTPEQTPEYASRADLCQADDSCYHLDFASFEHIEFGRIPANKVTVSEEGVTIDVRDSASILMQGFEEVRPVRHVDLIWRSEGRPAVRDAEHEKKKGGDDSVVKLGLLLRAEKERLNPFLPGWMKQVREGLTFPSEMIIYLVADSKHDTGQRWVSPYNDRVTMVSMDDAETGDGWYHSQAVFDAPVEVVGVWLMSDGDNTDSSFVTTVRDIVFR